MIQTNKGREGGEDKPGAVLSSFTGFLAAALPWKLRNPQSASLMSDDALVLMETLEKTYLEKEITCCPGSVGRHRPEEHSTCAGKLGEGFKRGGYTG